jgi:hypothetical protein
MNAHSAQYLDSGFYLVSDKAAGALVRVLGQKLPAQGWEKFVMIRTAKGTFNAWLKRTDLRHCQRTDVKAPRGWRWALHGIRPDGSGSAVVCGVLEAPSLGDRFTFTAEKSTLSKSA